MKTQGLNRLFTLFFLMIGTAAVNGQSESQVPGDNFSLEGALELFKKSASPEEFEKLLNDADSKVNNLDLNGDGYIDYIRVIDRNEGNIHAFILQAVVSDTESQDVAVISLEKLADGKAVLQITGDEDVYGVETIIEPTKEVRTYAGTTTSRVVVNVWAWPSVRYIYGPYYSSWISPWGWSYRPIWWRPWSPLAYYDYYPYWRPYRPYYSVCYTHRVFYGDYYRPYRRTSVIVHNRHYNEINSYRSDRRSGRDRYDGDRSRGRVSDGSIRYDENGRLASNNIQRPNSRTASDTWTSRPTRSGSSSRTTQSPTRSTTTLQRSGAGQRSESPEKWSGATRGNSPTPQSERTAVRTERSTSSESSNGRQSYNGSSGSNSVQRSQSSPNVQRSSSGSSYQRSSGNSGGQRYSSPSPQRSSGSSGVSRAPSRSSSGSSVQRSSGSSGGQRYSSPSRSSGSSGVSRSSSRSSSGSSGSRSGGSSGGRRGR